MSIRDGVRFVIPGSLQPERKREVPFQRHGRPTVARVDTKQAKDWKARAAYFAHKAMEEAGLPVYDEPLIVEFTWYRPRPSSQRKHDIYPHKRPDIKNYLAILEDAMEKIVYVDDARIVTEHLHKRFGDERVEVHVWPAIPDYPYRRQEE